MRKPKPLKTVIEKRREIRPPILQNRSKNLKQNLSRESYFSNSLYIQNTVLKLHCSSKYQVLQELKY